MDKISEIGHLDNKINRSSVENAEWLIDFELCELHYLPSLKQKQLFWNFTMNCVNFLTMIYLIIPLLSSHHVPSSTHVSLPPQSDPFENQLDVRESDVRSLNEDPK